MRLPGKKNPPAPTATTAATPAPAPGSTPTTAVVGAAISAEEGGTVSLTTTARSLTAMMNDSRLYRRQRAAAEYGELMARADAATEADAARLPELMQILELTPDDVTRHADARRRHAAELLNIGTPEQVQQLDAAVAAAEAEYDRAVAAYEKAKEAMALARLARLGASMKTGTAEQVTRDLVARNPLAFGKLPPEREPVLKFNPGRATA